MMHQYIDRASGEVVTERLFADRFVRFLYSHARERAPLLFRALTGRHFSAVLALANFDLPFAPHLAGNTSWLARYGIDLEECVEPPGYYGTPRRVFERRIRYWECRPLPADPHAVVSPADARALVGALRLEQGVFAKERFFSFAELLGPGTRQWGSAFEGGDYALFRLTPDQYHYNHVPVAGRVVDFYEVDGYYHSCNPQAVVRLCTPYSSNRRTVTIVDTDVAGGTGVGTVGMVEVVALMIGQVVQCYSEVEYRDPQPVTRGAFLHRGAPKSLFRPGSSTDVLLFQPGRVAFAADLVANQRRRDAESRFSTGFDAPLVETHVRVRSLLATRRASRGG